MSLSYFSPLARYKCRNSAGQPGSDSHYAIRTLAMRKRTQFIGLSNAAVISRYFIRFFLVKNYRV